MNSLIKKGDRVFHRKYGKGVATLNRFCSIIVLFDDGVQRTIIEGIENTRYLKKII